MKELPPPWRPGTLEARFDGVLIRYAIEQLDDGGEVLTLLVVLARTLAATVRPG